MVHAHISSNITPLISKQPDSAPGRCPFYAAVDLERVPLLPMLMTQD